MSLFQAMSITEITRVHNTIAEHKGEKTVAKFRDKRAAENRLQNISRGIARPEIVRYFQKACISKEIIDQIPKVSKPVNTPSVPATENPQPEATAEMNSQQQTKKGRKQCSKNTDSSPKKEVVSKKASQPIAQKSPAAKANGKVTPVPAPSKEEKRAASKKASAKPTVGASTESTIAAAEPTKVPAKLIVLAAVRELIPVGATGDAATTTSTKIARHLKTSILTVCKALQQLASAKLIRLEDDSPNDSNPFYYISLTKAGLAKQLPTVVVPKKELPSERPGPTSKFTGKKLYKLGEWATNGTNPRREGTHGYKSWELIKNGMTFEQYREAGGRNNDLQCEIEHGRVEVK